MFSTLGVKGRPKGEIMAEKPRSRWGWVGNSYVTHTHSAPGPRAAAGLSLGRRGQGVLADRYFFMGEGLGVLLARQWKGLEATHLSPGSVWVSPAP